MKRPKTILMNMKRFGIAIGAMAMILLAIPASSPADLSLDVSPAKYELQVLPGKTETIPIIVRNTGDAQVHIQTSLSDFTVGRDGNYQFVASGKAQYSMGTWVSVNPREFDLDPQTFMQVRFTINVPAGVTGEYSTLVFFTTRPSRKPGGLAIAERVASKLYEIAPDTARFAGEIDDVSTKADESGEHYLVAFHNTGNAHVYLSGRVEIKQGSQIVERVLIPKDQLVERNGKRLIEMTGKKLPAGSYNAVALVDYGGPNLIAGQTTFTVR
jgi:P pilus assembly chaperone PapD